MRSISNENEDSSDDSSFEMDSASSSSEEYVEEIEPEPEPEPVANVVQNVEKDQEDEESISEDSEPEPEPTESSEFEQEEEEDTNNGDILSNIQLLDIDDSAVSEMTLVIEYLLKELIDISKATANKLDEKMIKENHISMATGSRESWEKLMENISIESNFEEIKISKEERDKLQPAVPEAYLVACETLSPCHGLRTYMVNSVYFKKETAIDACKK